MFCLIFVLLLVEIELLSAFFFIQTMFQRNDKLVAILVQNNISVPDTPTAKVCVCVCFNSEKRGGVTFVRCLLREAIGSSIAGQIA